MDKVKGKKKFNILLVDKISNNVSYRLRGFNICKYVTSFMFNSPRFVETLRMVKQITIFPL